MSMRKGKHQAGKDEIAKKKKGNKNLKPDAHQTMANHSKEIFSPSSFETELPSKRPEDGIISLQESHGNAYVEKIVERVEAEKQSGKPLKPSVRTKMEKAFNKDFKNVRVHEGKEADALAKDLNAKAFTTGHDIFFREGECQPETREGEKLLAHELTHVAQQDGSTENATRISSPSETGEMEAASTAEALTQDINVSSRQFSGMTGTLSRDADDKAGGDKKDEEPKTMLVSITMAGAGTFSNKSFKEATNIVRTYVEAEQKSCEDFVKKVNEDQWIVSFWAEVLGGTKPPAYELWIKPLYSLNAAEQLMNAGLPERARPYLEKAVEQFNTVHQAWLAYREGVSKGAERAITGMKITITVLSAAATAGAGSAVTGGLSTGTKLLAEAGISAGMKAVEEGFTTAGELGYGLETKIDIARIAKNVGLAFVSSLVGGALSKGFLSMLTPKLMRASELGVLLPADYALSQTLISNFLGGTGSKMLEQAVNRAYDKFKGKEITMMEFLEEIANQFIDLGATEAFKASLEAVAKK